VDISVSRVLLWLFVVALGIQIGAGIYETRVIVPLWSSAPPESVVAYNLQALRPESGTRFWIFATPLLGLLGLANLFVAWRSNAGVRAWWLFAAAAVVVVVAVTFIYFVPELMRFAAWREGAGAPIESRVRLWVALNWVRVVVLVAAWLSLLRAFSGGALGE
jgi:hypothetical protein